jgi:general stress protein CsbA
MKTELTKAVKNLSKPTPAKWVKIGLTLTAISAAINGYGLTQGIQWVSILGLVCLVIGTVVTNMFAENQPNNEQ